MPEAAGSEVNEFFDALLGYAPEDKHTLLWTLQNKRSTWVPLTNGPRAVAKEAALLSDDGMDVYVSVSVADAPGTKETRIKSENSTGLMGLWADIDIADPDIHKKFNLPPDEAAAMDLLERAGMPPSLVVHSGHGLQAWWLFTEFWGFDGSSEERLAAAGLAQRWNTTLRVRAAERQWTVDSTFDLARVMRVPGTMNRKGTPAMPVRLLVHDGPRYDPSDFDQFLVDDKFLLSQGFTPTAEYQMDEKVELSEAHEPPFEKFQAMLANNEQFERTWKAQRKDLTDQSPSTYDLSVATFCALAEWTDQEIADTIFAWRRLHKHDTSKALRRDYIARTIAKARAAADRDRSFERMEELKEQVQEAQRSGDPDAQRETRRAALDNWARGQLGFFANNLFKYKSDPPSFRLVTPHGSVDLGGIEGITNWLRFYNSVLAVTGHSIPPFKQQAWHTICSALPTLWEEQDIGAEATEKGQMESWVQQYLAQRPPVDSVDEAALSEYPFVMEDGKVAIFGPGLKRWLYIQHQEKLTPKQLGVKLRHYGADPKTVNITVDGKKTSRSIWVLPAVTITNETGEAEDDADVEAEAS